MHPSTPVKPHTEKISLQLPSWLSELVSQHRHPLDTPQARMRLAIELARLNIEQGTGGPFGAAIFDMASHRLIAAGVNLVLPSGYSLAHAEMIAISSAQQKLGHFDLGASEFPRFELVSSSEPCAMCFGALPWSGIRHLACGARAEDAAAIGFDEGPKHPHWIEELKQRDITVERDICRDEAVKVLQLYRHHQGVIYNARQG